MIHRASCAASLLICGLLSACGEAPAPAAGPAASTDAAPKAVAGNKTDAVAAAAVGPAALPMNIGFRLDAKPVIGKAQKLGLSVTSTEGFEALEIVASSAGVAVDSQGARLSIAPVEAGRSYDLELAFTPTQPGITDIVLEVKAQSAAGQGQMRFAVPVLVEPPAAAGG